MGLKLELGDAGPNLPEPVRRRSGGAAALRNFDPETETGFLMDAIRGLVREVGPDRSGIGLRGGGVGRLACYMVEGRTKEGFTTVKSFMYREPKSVSRIAEPHRNRQRFPICCAQIAAGAAAVQLFDTWCGELNLREYLEFALPPMQEIISSLRKTVPVIYYTKASNHLLLAAADSGAEVLSVDWRVGFTRAAESTGTQDCPAGECRSGAFVLPQRRRFRRVTQQTAASLGGVGHILNLGHGNFCSTRRSRAPNFLSRRDSKRISRARRRRSRRVEELSERSESHPWCRCAKNFASAKIFWRATTARVRGTRATRRRRCGTIRLARTTWSRVHSEAEQARSPVSL